MTTKEARWLEKDGVVNFYIDAEAAREAGAKEPEGLRSNGQPWNPPSHPGEGIPQAESVAKVQEGTEAVAAKREAREAKEAESSAIDAQGKRETRK